MSGIQNREIINNNTEENIDPNVLRYHMHTVVWPTFYSINLRPDNGISLSSSRVLYARNTTLLNLIQI
jgi:hypothetical protein